MHYVFVKIENNSYHNKQFFKYCVLLRALDQNVNISKLNMDLWGHCLLT